MQNSSNLAGLEDERHSLHPQLTLIASFLDFAKAVTVDPTLNVRVLDSHIHPFSPGSLGIIAHRAVGPILAIIMGLLARVPFALFVFNMRGRLVPGDGSAYAIAIAIGLLFIVLCHTVRAEMLRAYSADELVPPSAAQVRDSFRLSYKRSRQARSPISADRDHLRDDLQDRFGWPECRINGSALSFLPAVVAMSW